MQKATLRKLVREYRNEVPRERWMVLSEGIQSNAASIVSMLNAKNVHVYLASPGHLEVDTSELYNKLLANHIITAVPRVLSDSGDMESVIVNYNTRFQPNKWGIREPVDGEVASPDIFDIVFVPMLGADMNGNRLGFGKGFYDRFLAITEAVKVGLCPEDYMFDRIPSEPHDVSMDFIITESRIIRIK
ncbi:MAG: 5-formyltetrahydrofolate cyclo-ligase [Balneolales bacterium]|nr:5-formyltetrahydrofolate cyclo-ligase [Balneolales bacterium]